MTQLSKKVSIDVDYLFDNHQEKFLTLCENNGLYIDELVFEEDGQVVDISDTLSEAFKNASIDFQHTEGSKPSPHNYDAGEPDEVVIFNVNIDLCGKTLDIQDFVDKDKLTEELCEYARS